MFTPNQEKAASELIRVCRPGGKIGLANWTPEGFIGRLFKIIGKYVPPAPGVKSPALWGTKAHLDTMFGSKASVAAESRTFAFRYKSPAHWVELFRGYYGPVLKAFAALDPKAREALEADIYTSSANSTSPRTARSSPRASISRSSSPRIANFRGVPGDTKSVSPGPPVGSGFAFYSLPIREIPGRFVMIFGLHNHDAKASVMIFRQLFDSTSSTYTYLLASRHGGEALIIDPVIERVDRYTQLLTELDLRLVKAIDTHLHADHITGLEALRERTQCITIMGEQTKADVVSIRVTDGDRVDIEGLSLDVTYTPGHTDDSYSFLMPDRVFTGDTLLIRMVTRAPNTNPFSGASSSSRTRLWSIRRTTIKATPSVPSARRRPSIRASRSSPPTTTWR
jgi:glyoxylase-like metal-dependent hydrolase (beta-lactamase superfamily II)